MTLEYYNSYNIWIKSNILCNHHVDLKESNLLHFYVDPHANWPFLNNTTILTKSPKRLHAKL